MAFNFPSSPTVNQIYTSGASTYKYNGSAWILTASVAPFDAMAYSGMQINGGFDVAQEFGASGTLTSYAYPVDGWQLVYKNTMQIGAAQTSPQTKFAGYLSHLFINVLIPLATFAADDFAYITQAIEGYRCARLAWGTANAQPVTISFWTAHNKSGVYSLVIMNRNKDRTYAATYTQAAADVPQYNTFTIPGDTAGTWEKGNLAGMMIFLSVGCGTTGIAPSTNSWLSGGYIASPGQVNAVATTSDISYFAGVTVLPGTQGPTAAQSPNIMRPYGEELMTCKRYWQPYGSGGFAGAAEAPSYIGISGLVSPVMRVAPTVGVLSGAGAYFRTAGGIDIATSTPSLANPAAIPSGVWTQVGGFSGLTTGQAVFSRGFGDFISLDARL